MDQNTKSSLKNKQIIFSIIISIIITTLVVGSGVYFWQKSVSNKEKENAI
jgi:flagellar basal body-associated protein FliL